MKQPAPIRRFAGNEDGNFAVLFAVFLAIGTVFGAFAVDEGSLYLQRRQAQSATDLASIAAAADPGQAFARARAVFADAGLVDPALSDAALASGTGPVTLSVDAGTYSPDPGLDVADRFQPGNTPANAVRVRFRSRGRLYFAASWAAVPDVGTEAVASATPEVMFSVGSTLAQLQDGIPNAVLSGLLGADVTLSAASYNGLLDARVDVFRFLDALAQQLHITAGTYGDVLAASAGSGDIASAIATSLDGADAVAANVLAGQIGSGRSVPVGRLFDLGDAARLDIGTGTTSGVFATVSALNLLAAAGAVSDGTHQVVLGLGAGVPGLIGLSMQLVVGEPPQMATWFTLGPDGTIARTAQIRLQFVATLGGGALLSHATVRVPVYVEAAYAEAAVQSAACPAAGASTGSATIAAQPGIVRVVLGEPSASALADFSSSPDVPPAKLIDLLLLKVTGSGTAAAGDIAPVDLPFSASDIAAGTVQQASTTTPVQSLATSVLSTLSLNVTALGLGLPSTAVIKSAVGSLVAPLGPVLDATITATLDAIGLKLGIADVQVYGVSCGRAVLVG